MKTVIGIPSGQRETQLLEVCKAWQARGFNICVLTWDKKTENLLSQYIKFDAVCQRMKSPTAWHMFIEEYRKSFAVNQNRMMRKFADWDLWICGADDLFPGIRVEKLAEIAERFDDKLLWCLDGRNPLQMTHPVVTRRYWEKVKGQVFDERYTHNYCDTHLMMTAAEDIIKLVGIQFDHRWRKNGVDDIYRIGGDSFAADRAKFIEQFGQDAQLPRIREVIC